MSFTSPSRGGFRGSTDNLLLRGLQARNQRNLLEIFNAASPVIEEIAKTKPETWRRAREFFKGLSGAFGVVQQIGGGVLTPFRALRARTTAGVEGLLTPVMVGINRVSSQIESKALQNQQGAIVGAGVGYALSFALPGGPLLWSLLLAGAGIQIQAGIGGDRTNIFGMPFPDPSQIGQPGFNPFAPGGGGPLQVSATEGPVPPPAFIRPPRAVMLQNLNRAMPNRQMGGFTQFG